VRRHTLDRRVTRKKSLALCQRYGMRRNLRDSLECRSRNSDQVVGDWNDNFRLNMQAARHEQIVRTMYRPGETIFDRSKHVIREPFLHARIERLKRRPRHKLDFFPKKFDGSFFAERASLPLKRNSRRN